MIFQPGQLLIPGCAGTDWDTGVGQGEAAQDRGRQGFTTFLDSSRIPAPCPSSFLPSCERIGISTGGEQDCGISIPVGWGGVEWGGMGCPWGGMCCLFRGAGRGSCALPTPPRWCLVSQIPDLQPLNLVESSVNLVESSPVRFWSGLGSEPFQAVPLSLLSAPAEFEHCPSKILS